MKKCLLHIYINNESPQNVYFDDLKVKHISGPLLQEQSYYPFGLQMAGISSKAVLKTLSAYKYNAGSELEDEGELNYYNTFYRKYDAQIGRFTGIDMLAESYAGLTPFQFGNNNPVFYNDPTGAKLEMKEEERESKVIHQLPGFFRGLYSQGMQNFENWMMNSMDDAERGTGSGEGSNIDAINLFNQILKNIDKGNGIHINEDGNVVANLSATFLSLALASFIGGDYNSQSHVIEYSSVTEEHRKVEVNVATFFNKL